MMFSPCAELAAFVQTVQIVQDVDRNRRFKSSEFNVAPHCTNRFERPKSPYLPDHGRQKVVDLFLPGGRCGTPKPAYTEDNFSSQRCGVGLEDRVSSEAIPPEGFHGGQFVKRRRPVSAPGV